MNDKSGKQLNIFCPKCKGNLDFNGHHYKSIQCWCEKCCIYWHIDAYLLKLANGEVIEINKGVTL